jgi:hypothetical protein
VTPLLLITCKLPSCQRQFLVCSRCFRGHKYCSTEHASEARAASVKEARKKYASSPKGLAKQRVRARRYYLKKTRKNSLTDRSTTAPSDVGTLRRANAPNERSSARTEHAEAALVPDPPPTQPAPPRVRCLWCRRIGSRVLFRSRRFHR